MFPCSEKLCPCLLILQLGSILTTCRGDESTAHMLKSILSVSKLNLIREEFRKTINANWGWLDGKSLIWFLFLTRKCQIYFIWNTYNPIYTKNDLRNSGGTLQQKETKREKESKWEKKREHKRKRERRDKKREKERKIEKKERKKGGRGRKREKKQEKARKRENKRGKERKREKKARKRREKRGK